MMLLAWNVNCLKYSMTLQLYMVTYDTEFWTCPRLPQVDLILVFFDPIGTLVQRPGGVMELDNVMRSPFKQGSPGELKAR